MDERGKGKGSLKTSEAGFSEAKTSVTNFSAAKTNKAHGSKAPIHLHAAIKPRKTTMPQQLTIALSKGRIFEETLPLLAILLAAAWLLETMWAA